MDVFAEVVGLIGALLLLLAFFMITNEKWTRLSLKYQGANLIASSLLLGYSILKSAYAFIALNIVWAMVALFGLLKARKKQIKSK